MSKPLQQVQRIRTLFPETWLWCNKTVGYVVYIRDCGVRGYYIIYIRQFYRYYCSCSIIWQIILLCSHGLSCIILIAFDYYYCAPVVNRTCRLDDKEYLIFPYIIYYYEVKCSVSQHGRVYISKLVPPVFDYGMLDSTVYGYN
jgi:hypothetical protein